MKDYKLLICGDIIPTESNEAAMAARRADELFGDALGLFKSADFVFANIEGAFTSRGTPINKCGPNLRGDPAAAAILDEIGVDLCGLANNHTLDFGWEGLSDTFETLDALKIPHRGAGENLAAARIPYRFSLGGREITILTVAEHEFTIAAKNRAGANPFDVYDTMEDIENEKKAGRLVIVIYHGGKEHYALTSPETRRRCRKMAERGADFIFCQHTHCVCCREIYKGCEICYGQGNTLFDHSNHIMWKTLLLPVITLAADGSVFATYHPAAQEGGRIKLAHGSEADAIMLPFAERSEKLADEDYIDAKWLEFAVPLGEGMLKAMKLLGPDGEPENYRNLTVLSNYYRCEIHHETIYRCIEEKRRRHYGDLLVLGRES